MRAEGERVAERTFSLGLLGRILGYLSVNGEVSVEEAVRAIRQDGRQHGKRGASAVIKRDGRMVRITVEELVAAPQPPLARDAEWPMQEGC